MHAYIWYMHKFLLSYMHTYTLHTYKYTYMHEYIHAWIHTCMHKCKLANMHTEDILLCPPSVLGVCCGKKRGERTNIHTPTTHSLTTPPNTANTNKRTPTSHTTTWHCTHIHTHYHLTRHTHIPHDTAHTYTHTYIPLSHTAACERTGDQCRRRRCQRRTVRR